MLSAHHHEIYQSAVRCPAVLEEENSLPSAQGQLMACNGDHLTCARERHAEVAGRIVAALRGVKIIRVIFGDHFFEPSMQIFAGAGIGIFIDDKTCAGMSDEHGCRSDSHPACPDDAPDIGGEFVGSLASCMHRQCFVVGFHFAGFISNAQPTRKSNPPMGVMAPSHLMFVRAST